MKRKLILIGCLLLLVVGGAYFWLSDKEQRLLQNSDEFVFYTIQPSALDSTHPEAERFHNHRVLGKVTITDPSEKAALIQALFYSFKGHLRSEASCHLPRHAIRATRNGHVLELSICFECKNVYFFQGERFFRHEVMCDDTIEGAKELFDQIVQKYRLPLAKKIS